MGRFGRRGSGELLWGVKPRQGTKHQGQGGGGGLRAWSGYQGRRGAATSCTTKTTLPVYWLCGSGQAPPMEAKKTCLIAARPGSCRCYPPRCVGPRQSKTTLPVYWLCGSGQAPPTEAKKTCLTLEGSACLSDPPDLPSLHRGIFLDCGKLSQSENKNCYKSTAKYTTKSAGPLCQCTGLAVVDRPLQ